MPMHRKLFVLASGALAVFAVSIVPGFTSSHREAPLTARDPQIDATDLYAFVSPDNPDTVTLISNWYPYQEPAGGPNFYRFGEGVRYNINIDSNGDAQPDITYRWTFTSEVKNQDTFLYNTGPVKSLSDETLNFTQSYKLEQVRGDEATTVIDSAPVAPSFVGKASMPDYASLRQEAIVAFKEGEGKSFAGQADDPFFLDLRVFDLLYGGDLSEVGNDTLSGYNVLTTAIQVPKSALAGDGDNQIIGLWTTAERQGARTQGADGTEKVTGDFVQVSRLGHPLVNEVVVPLQFKDAFNASKPVDDKQFLPKVQDPEVPKLIEKIYGIAAPKTPRDDLVSVFLTGVDKLNKPANVVPSEQLRLNMSIAPSSDPNPLGVLAKDTAGFPNGRRLTDDVLDIELKVLEGALTGADVTMLGDGVDANDVAFENAFPYVALPHSGSETGSRSGKAARGGTGGTAPAGGAAAGGGGTASGSSSPVVPAAAGGAGALLAAAGLVAWRRHRRVTA